MHRSFGVLFFFLEQPMHPGSGSSVSYVDLPIQREVYTRYPMIQASGVKGALRDAAEKVQNPLTGQEIDMIFGPRGATDAGAILVTDARTLLFPVKSALGVFGWATCPHVLARLKADLEVAGPAGSDSQLLRALGKLSRDLDLAPERALWPADSPLTLSGRLLLEERLFTRPAAGVADALASELDGFTSILAEQALHGQGYWKKLLPRKTAVVPDDAFKDFVRFCVEIETHIQMGENGTVAEGPWDEELIPAETLMYSLVGFQAGYSRGGDGKLVRNREASTALETFQRGVANPLPHLQIGGDATLGRGIAAMRFAPVETLLAATAPATPTRGGRG